jgi:hypothetical protein
MPCVFCGKDRKLSKEHYFPKWLSAYLPGDQPYWVLEQDRFGEHPFEIRRPSKKLEFTVRVVCETCNNGWMSQMEAQTKPLLEELLTSTTIRPLTKKEQLSIARWATKTAMMIDFTQEEPLVPEADRRGFGRYRSVPKRAWIWLGACEELLPLTMSQTVKAEMEPLEGGKRGVGFFNPIKIGHLIIYFVLPPQTVEVHLRWHWALGTIKIWPKPREFFWPPLARMRDGKAFDEYASSFWEELLLVDPSRARA